MFQMFNISLPQVLNSGLYKMTSLSHEQSFLCLKTLTLTIFLLFYLLNQKCFNTNKIPTQQFLGAPLIFSWLPYGLQSTVLWQPQEANHGRFRLQRTYCILNFWSINYGIDIGENNSLTLVGVLLAKPTDWVQDLFTTKTSSADLQCRFWHISSKNCHYNHVFFHYFVGLPTM